MSIRLTSDPISLAAAMKELKAPGLGGIVVFAGRVRPDRSRTGRVIALEYDAHPAPALRRLRELERIARRRFGAERTVLWHRVGVVPVDRISVIVGAACVHRGPAFAATRYLIDALKTTVPIWKTDRERSSRPPRRRPGRSGARSSG